jgi:hypothetical protein
LEDFQYERDRARARQADSIWFAQTTSNLKPWFCKTELARLEAVERTDQGDPRFAILGRHILDWHGATSILAKVK